MLNLHDHTNLYNIVNKNQYLTIVNSTKLSEPWVKGTGDIKLLFDFGLIKIKSFFEQYDPSMNTYQYRVIFSVTLKGLFELFLWTQKYERIEKSFEGK